MNKDDLKKIIAKKVGVSVSEQDLATQILLDNIAANLNNVKNAVQITELGIFQLNEDKTHLIYSPVSENFSGQSKSFYMKLDIPNPPLEGLDLDDDVFSLSIGAPIVPIEDKLKFRDSSETSFIVIKKQIEERVRNILSESSYFKNFNLLEDYLNPTLAGETDDSTDEFDESTETPVKIEEELEIGEKIDFDEIEPEINLEEEQLADDISEEYPGSDVIKLNNSEIFDIDKAEADDDHEADDSGNQRFGDTTEFYSYPEDDNREKESTREFDEDIEAKDELNPLDEEIPDDDVSIDYETFKNLSLEDLDDSGESETDNVEDHGVVTDKPEIGEPTILDEDAVDRGNVEHEKKEKGDKIFDKTEPPGEDYIFKLDEVELSDEDKSSVEWNWGDELKDENNESAKEANDVDGEDSEIDEDPFGTLEKTISEDADFKRFTSVDERSEKEKSSEGVESQKVDENIAEAIMTEEKMESSSFTEDRTPEKGETAESKISNFRERSSVSSLVVIISFLVIVTALLYFLFFSGTDPIKESSDIPSQEEMISDAPVEGQGGETANGNVPAATEVITNSGTNDLYREYDGETRVSNLVFKYGNKYNVQVSSWKNPIKAENEVKRLRNEGYDAFIVKAYLPTKGGTWHRVRIGGFNSVDEARKFSNDYQQ